MSIFISRPEPEVEVIDRNEEFVPYTGNIILDIIGTITLILAAIGAAVAKVKSIKERRNRERGEDIIYLGSYMRDGAQQSLSEKMVNP